MTFVLHGARYASSSVRADFFRGSGGSEAMYSTNSFSEQPRKKHSRSRLSVVMFAPSGLFIRLKVARWMPVAKATSSMVTRRPLAKANSAILSWSLNRIMTE